MKMLLMSAMITLCQPLSSMADDFTTAPHRSNAQNYKDRALASCIAQAYEGSPAGEDARVTTISFIDWLYFDLEAGQRATNQLVDQYLQRDYSTPLEGYQDARFDLLKCIDMYHSDTLEQQSRTYTSQP
jgi:hypothetical protein